MNATDNLTPEQLLSLQDAQDKLTIEMLNGLGYGEEQDLNELFCVYHYNEEDCVVLNLKEEWDEILQVLWDNETKQIFFESL